MKLTLIADCYELEVLEHIIDKVLKLQLTRPEDLLCQLVLLDFHKRNAQALYLKRNQTKLKFNDKESLAFFILTRNESDLYIINIRTLIHKQIC